MAIKKVLAVVAASALITACGSNQPVQQAEVPSCVYMGTQTAAPDWVCGAPIAGVEMSAVGYADKSAAGMSFMKQMAVASARVELASTMKTQVQNMIKQYTEVTGVGDDETVDRVNTSVTKTITSETLTGSRVIRQIPTPSGGMAVLVGMDPEAVATVVEKSVKTSMANDRALWQKFQAEKSFDEMAEEIAKMDGQ